MWGVCSFRGQTVLARVVIVPPWRRAPPVRDFRGIPSHLPVGARPNSLWEGGATVRPSRGLSPKPRSPPGGSGVHGTSQEPGDDAARSVPRIRAAPSFGHPRGGSWSSEPSRGKYAAHRKVLRPRYDLKTPQSKLCPGGKRGWASAGKSPVFGAPSDATPKPTARDSRSRPPPPVLSSPTVQASPVSSSDSRSPRRNRSPGANHTQLGATPDLEWGAWDQEVLAAGSSAKRRSPMGSKFATCYPPPPVPPGPIKYRAGWCALNSAGPRELARPKSRVITMRE